MESNKSLSEEIMTSTSINTHGLSQLERKEFELRRTSDFTSFKILLQQLYLLVFEEDMDKVQQQYRKHLVQLVLSSVGAKSKDGPFNSGSSFNSCMPSFTLCGDECWNELFKQVDKLIDSIVLLKQRTVLLCGEACPSKGQEECTTRPGESPLSVCSTYGRGEEVGQLARQDSSAHSKSYEAFGYPQYQNPNQPLKSANRTFPQTEFVSQTNTGFQAKSQQQTPVMPSGESGKLLQDSGRQQEHRQHYKPSALQEELVGQPKTPTTGNTAITPSSIQSLSVNNLLNDYINKYNTAENRTTGHGASSFLTFPMFSQVTAPSDTGGTTADLRQHSNGGTATSHRSGDESDFNWRRGLPSPFPPRRQEMETPESSVNFEDALTYSPATSAAKYLAMVKNRS